MKFFRLFIFLILLSGCSQDGSLQKSIISVLKDPDSAKFGKVKYFKSYACYEVNAKNSMGGYTGKQVAFMNKIDNSWHVVRFEKTTIDDCMDRFIAIDEKEMVANKNKNLAVNSSEKIPPRCVGNPDLKACLEFEKKYPSDKINSSDKVYNSDKNKVLDLFRQ
jgi:hypothetical protein